MNHTDKKNNQSRFKMDYQMITWFDNALPDITVTMRSGKSTYRFIGSYDGDHALTAKLLTHMANDTAVKDSEKR